MKVSNTDRLKFLGEEMERMNAPRDMIEALEEITEISAKKEVTKQDAKNIMRLARKMQKLAD